MEKLPKRLRAVASVVPPCKTAADIGTDHGLLAVYLIQSGIASRVVASDINPGPYQKAKARICISGLEDFIDVRLGNGLNVLQPGEAEVIIISGLGGYTIVEILNEGQAVLKEADVLVLNPVTHQSEVRHWLKENGWKLSDEELVEDQGRLYQVIAACPDRGNESESWSQLEYDAGPLIIRKRHPLLKEYLRRKLKKYERAVDNLKKSPSPLSVQKRKKLMSSVAEIKTLLASLPGVQEEGNDNL
ncbi:MAG TPA: SAM-dependent methyltransferase [Clostridia bacterium]|jgi:tRNA (adenine22-N1)-methyltransferase|nr:SAM-dependent methyltransferase [Clostridia bacterium]